MKLLSNDRKIENRTSGVELLKVIAIFLVMLCHVVSTLGTNAIDIVGFNDYFINIALPSKNVQHVVLGIACYSGIMGNALFFISSAWYLLDKKKTNVQKIFRMFCEIFIISLFWLIVTLLFTNFKLSDWYIRLSLMPTKYCNNWYLTVYMIFSFIFPFLNIVIKNINQRQHLVLSIFVFICYVFLPFKGGFPFTNELILWIALYMIIGYFKFYGMKICDNLKLNRIVLVLAIAIQLFLIIKANVFYLRGLDSKHLHTWLSNYNVFLYIIAFAAVNIYRNKKFKSSIINYLASFSMLVYIIHENILFRTFYRPHIWQWIYLNFNYDYILLWALLFVIVLFILTYLVSIFYSLFLQRFIYEVINEIYYGLKKLGTMILNLLTRVLHQKELE